MSNVLSVYTKDNCKYCSRLKVFLKRNNIPFQEKNILDNIEFWKFYKSHGHEMVPQVYVNETLFVEGGAEGVMSLSYEELNDKLKLFGIMTLDTDGDMPDNL